MTKMLVELLFCPCTFCGGPSGSDIKDQNRLMYLTELLKICEVHILLFFWNTSQIRVYVGAKTCEVSLCFVTIVEDRQVLILKTKTELCTLLKFSKPFFF